MYIIYIKLKRGSIQQRNYTHKGPSEKQHTTKLPKTPFLLLLHQYTCFLSPRFFSTFHEEINNLTIHTTITIPQITNFHCNNLPILMKTKPMNQTSNSTMYSFNSPWEEAGLVWPPRFYSCSFCRREFRSAQALGGHMNVHRRDRAKLKQSNPTSDQEINTNPAAFSNVIKTTSATTTYEENTRKLIDLVDSDDDGDGEPVMCKRYKKSSGVSPLMKILYFSNNSSREEIDLELRLGAVK